MNGNVYRDTEQTVMIICHSRHSGTYVTAVTHVTAATHAIGTVSIAAKRARIDQPCSGFAIYRGSRPRHAGEFNPARPSYYRVECYTAIHTVTLPTEDGQHTCPVCGAPLQVEWQALRRGAEPRRQ
jgi:hypothetical protein